MLGAGCPGASNLWGTPTLAIKKCPECGSEVEIFSSDVKVKCRNCGFVVFNDIQSCIEWCKYAEKCLGGPLYKQLKTAAEERKKKEAGEKEAKKKEAGKKEAGEKDAKKKEAGKKEAGEKDAGKKEAEKKEIEKKVAKKKDVEGGARGKKSEQAKATKRKQG